jgi:hypothetical protein
MKKYQWQMNEKVLNIFNHQRNTNQKYIEAGANGLLPPSCSGGRDEEDYGSMLALAKYFLRC